MNAQTTITAYPLGGTWADMHPKAVEYIVNRCRVDNARGRKGRLQAYIEEMRLTPHEFDLTAEGNRYGFDHRLRSEVARHIAATYGVEFAIRKATCDHAATNATPEVRAAS